MRGRVYVLTGDGKGKTTAAIGMIVRAIGRGRDAVLIQFLKGRSSGEITTLEALSKFGFKIKVHRFGTGRFVNPANPSDEDLEEVRRGMEMAYGLIKEKPFMLVLDEILVASSFRMVEVSEILRLIELARDNGVHLVLTGRNAPDPVLEAADLVTEMKKVKHYFDCGGEAIEGIEY